MSILSKREALKRSHRRIRKKVLGTEERPRLSVHKSGKNIHAQIINDIEEKTIVAMTSLNAEVRKKFSHGGNCECASLVGELLAKLALEKGVNKVVFDRGGHLYHGRIKALAESARAAGLEF